MRHVPPVELPAHCPQIQSGGVKPDAHLIAGATWALAAAGAAAHPLGSAMREKLAANSRLRWKLLDALENTKWGVESARTLIQVGACL